MNNSPDSSFSELHTLLTNALISRIKDGSATAADLSVARQMLKDNGINSTGAQKPIRKLAEILPFEDPQMADGEHRDGRGGVAL